MRVGNTLNLREGEQLEGEQLLFDIPPKGRIEEQLRAIAEQTAYRQRLRERKATVLKRIAEQGKLTPALRAAIEAATTMQAVEDLYRPYRPKRRTRATIARRRGLVGRQP